MSYFRCCACSCICFVRTVHSLREAMCCPDPFPGVSPPSVRTHPVKWILLLLSRTDEEIEAESNLPKVNRLLSRSPTEAPDVRNVPRLPRPQACPGLLEAEATSGCCNGDGAVGKTHGVCHRIRASFSRLRPANHLDDTIFVCLFVCSLAIK